jgi:hypothetical protein
MSGGRHDVQTQNQKKLDSRTQPNAFVFTMCNFFCGNRSVGGWPGPLAEVFTQIVVVLRSERAPEFSPGQARERAALGTNEDNWIALQGQQRVCATPPAPLSGRSTLWAFDPGRRASRLPWAGMLRPFRPMIVLLICVETSSVGPGHPTAYCRQDASVPYSVPFWRFGSSFHIFAQFAASLALA